MLKLEFEREMVTCVSESAAELVTQGYLNDVFDRDHSPFFVVESIDDRFSELL